MNCAALPLNRTQPETCTIMETLLACILALPRAIFCGVILAGLLIAIADVITSHYPE